MRPGDRRTKTMDRDPNTESKAQCLAELSSLSLPDKPPRSRKQAKEVRFERARVSVRRIELTMHSVLESASECKWVQGRPSLS